MNYDRFLNPRVVAVPPSGIRRFFDLAATMKDAISLGVGEPDFITPYHIRNAAINSIVDGETQYTPNRGLLTLRQEISRYLEGRYHTPYDPATEIIVTVGASESIDVALRAMLAPGDEVLVPEPSYVSYSPSVIFAGGTPVGVETREDTDFRLSSEKVRAAITPRTKALILPSIASAMGLFLMRQSMSQVPDAMIEAAKVDGANLFTTCWRIVIPNQKPALMTMSIFAFQGAWNIQGGSLVYDEAKKTLPTVVQQAASAGLARAGVAMAAAVFMLIPPVVFFMLAQKNVIETMAHSGIKD